MDTLPPTRRRPALGAAAMAAAIATAASPTLTQPAPANTVVTLAEGVHAVLRTEPLSLAVNANSLVVVGDEGVLVVDAQFTRQATQETIAAIRRLTPKPVRWVVNTHWHDDHVAGNQVYRDSFPDVEFVLHADTRADLRTLGAPNRTGTRDAAPGLVEKFDRQLAAGLGVDSTPASALERESVASAIRIMRQYLAELPAFRETVDGPTVRDRLTLGRGPNRVEVRWFGRANTRGDLVVHLPEHGIVATGDVVVAPVPFGFGSYPAEWVPVLDSIAALRPRVLVPGHGPVMRDLSYLQRVRAMLVDVAAQAASAATRGDSLRAAVRAVALDEHRRALAGDEKWMNYLFASFFLRPAATAAFQQAAARPGAGRP